MRTPKLLSTLLGVAQSFSQLKIIDALHIGSAVVALSFFLVFWIAQPNLASAGGKVGLVASA